MQETAIGAPDNADSQIFVGALVGSFANAAAKIKEPQVRRRA
jgi:hypothetical protein